MLGIAPSEVERMSALDVMRLSRYAAVRPCGPEHLDILQALISSAILRAAGARVTAKDCLPSWITDSHDVEVDDDAVRAQAEALARALGGGDTHA